MNKKCILSYIASILALVAFISCASPAGGGSEGSETGLAVRMPGRALTSYDKTTVSIFTVTIKSSSYKETKSAGSGETITFSQIPVGTYEVNAIAKDASGTTIAKTKNPVTVIVEQDKVSETTVTLSLLEYAVVQFELNGGTAADGSSTIPDQNVTKGEYATAPANPTRTGFVFGGWKLLPPPGAMSTAAPINLATYPINDEITFQAIWKQAYSVTFDWDDGESTETNIEVLPGAYVLDSQIPNPPSGEGWTFAGWKLSETPVSTPEITSTPITGNTTYTAVWKFTVRYWSEDTLISSTQENFRESFSTLSTEPISSTAINIFKGWSLIQNDTNPGTPAGDTTTANVSDLRDNDGILNLYAVWEPFEFTAYAYQLANEITVNSTTGSGTYAMTQNVTSSATNAIFKALGNDIYEMFIGTTSKGSGPIQYLETDDPFISGGNKNRFYFYSTTGSGTHYMGSSEAGLTSTDGYKASNGNASDSSLMSTFGTP